MSLPVSSQSKHTGTFEIKTNLLNLIAAGPSLGLEYDLQNNFTIMFSAGRGRIDYGDFGGVTRYTTSTFELRKYSENKLLFIGPYLKNINKKVLSTQSIIAGMIPVGKERDFVGNGLSIGASTGIKFPLSHHLNVELNPQIGYGHYYKMTDKFNSLPTGNYLDARIALWFGFRL
jgi:hypothetical protein